MLGLSELCYIQENDTLLISFTSEDTSNSYDDGKIGDSYIALVPNASAELLKDEIKLAKLHTLSTVDKPFVNQKIEGMCYQFVGDGLTLHFVSDNDDGESRLFQVRVI
jgi:hypothetical protein